MGKINMATTTINTLLSLVQQAFNANKLQVSYGGTGVSSYNELRAQLGLGNDASAVLPVERGGTGVSSLNALKGAILSEGSTAMAVSQGGTGLDNLTAHRLLCGNGTNAVNLIGTNSTGVLQVNRTDTDPTFDVVPVALGGTGVTTKSLLSNLLGLGGATESGNNITYDPIPVGRGGTGHDNLNSLSNDLGLGETTNTAIPIARGGTGIQANSTTDIRSGIGAIGNRGDTDIQGDYVVNGTISIKNTNTGLVQYNLSDRLANIESRLAALEAK